LFAFEIWKPSINGHTANRVFFFISVQLRSVVGAMGALGPGHQGKTVYRGNQLPTYAFIPCREGTKNAPGRVPVLKSTLDLLDARNVPTPHRRCPGFPGRNVLCVGRQGATHPTPRVPCLSIFAPFKKRASRCAMTSWQQEARPLRSSTNKGLPLLTCEWRSPAARRQTPAHPWRRLAPSCQPSLP
jgi:hypothetical protein